MLNPEVSDFSIPSGLIATNWDEDSFWASEQFRFSGAFESSAQLTYSPFALVEARLSFLLSCLDKNLPTYLLGVPPLASLMYCLRSQAPVGSSEDFASYRNEYTSRVLPATSQAYQQVLALNQSYKGGQVNILLLASFESWPQHPVGYVQERVWEFDESSELGKLFICKFIR